MGSLLSDDGGPEPDRAETEKPRTAGNWTTEDQAKAEFDAIVERSGAFRIYREVTGEYIHPRPNTRKRDAGTGEAKDKDPRIDRLLVPLAPAVRAGWDAGIIGIELKKSGNKIGPLICQALDYARAVWRLDAKGENPGPPGMMVLTEWVFIFPIENPHGDLESVMANHRVGYGMIARGRLVLSAGGTNAITIDPDGRVAAKVPPMGGSRGSR